MAAWRVEAALVLCALLTTAALTAAEAAEGGETREGKTYYVSVDGDDANPGSLEKPWKTIGKANVTLKPGDTVILRRGVYGGQIRPKVSGKSEDKRIVYRAHPGEQGDVIQIGVNVVRVLKVDAPSRKLRIDRKITWKAGDGVSLPWKGARPDIGAFELGAPAWPVPSRRNVLYR